MAECRHERRVARLGPGRGRRHRRPRRARCWPSPATIWSSWPAPATVRDWSVPPSPPPGHQPPPSSWPPGNRLRSAFDPRTRSRARWPSSSAGTRPRCSASPARDRPGTARRPQVGRQGRRRVLHRRHRVGHRPRRHRRSRPRRRRTGSCPARSRRAGRGPGRAGPLRAASLRGGGPGAERPARPWLTRRRRRARRTPTNSTVLRLPGAVGLSDLSPEWAWGGATGTAFESPSSTAGSMPITRRSTAASIATARSTFARCRRRIELVQGPHGDDFGHGTACAGIIHALAPERRSPAFGCSAGLAGKATRFIAGLKWAVDQRFDVINLSLVRERTGARASTTVRPAYFNGTVFVTAANNAHRASFPSLFSSVISVACNTTTTRTVPLQPGTADGVPRPGYRRGGRRGSTGRIADRQLVRRPAHQRVRRPDPGQAPGSTSLSDQSGAVGDRRQRAGGPSALPSPPAACPGRCAVRRCPPGRPRRCTSATTPRCDCAGVPRVGWRDMVRQISDGVPVAAVPGR